MKDIQTKISATGHEKWRNQSPKLGTLLARAEANLATRSPERYGYLILRAVTWERIDDRRTSAYRYENEVPEGSRRSARQTHFWPYEVEPDAADEESIESSRMRLDTEG